MDQCQITGQAPITGLITAVVLCTVSALDYPPTIPLLPRPFMELTTGAPEA